MPPSHDITPSPLRLGAFEVLHELGRGGMGVVYAGRDAGGDEVVIKVLSRGAGAQEVRAAATLNHPHIVRVLDFGRASMETTRWAAHASYLVMERAPGRALSELEGGMSGPRWRALLEAVLDALAHAHARGVLHRDIKPANVMAKLSDDGASWARITLLDLGVASLRASAPGEDVRARGGTPAYMAPEQLSPRGSLPEGPWTDLYALGCMGYTLLTGRSPWWRPTLRAMLDAKHTEPPPPLVRQHAREEEEEEEEDIKHKEYKEVDGVESWLFTMLARDPRDRFQHAAHALEALRTLHMREVVCADTHDAPTHPPLNTPTSPNASLFTLGSLAHLSGLSFELSTMEDLASAREVIHRDTSERSPAHTPSMSWPVWRRAKPPELPQSGEGLARLRRVELVGRHDERDALWSRLQHARDSGSPKLVVVSGEAGCGKSALTRWCGERAHELGLATMVYGGCAPYGAHVEDWTRALLVHADALGLLADDDPQRQRLALETFLGSLDDEDQNASERLPLRPPSLAEQLHTLRGLRDGDDLTVPAPALARMVAELLSALAAHTPLIICLDDLQWSASLEDWAIVLKHLRGPILVLATLRPDHTNEGSLAGLRALVRARDDLWLPLAALPQDARHLLVAQVLGRAREALTSRRAGEAQARVWEVHALSLTTLIEAATAYVEGDSNALHDPSLWCGAALTRRRLSRALEPLPAPTRRAMHRALVLGATLGRRVDHTRWRRACALCGVDWPDGHMIRLVRAGLIARHHDTWTLHDALADTLADLATAEDHAVCAQALGGLTSSQAHSQQVAWHMLHAGQLDALCKVLYASITRWPRHAALALYDHILHAVTHDEGQLKGALTTTHLVTITTQTLDGVTSVGHSARTHELVERLHALLEHHTLPPNVRADAMEQLGWLALHMEQLDDSEAFARAAISLASGYPLVLCTSLRLLANTLIFQGAPVDALPLLERAHALIDTMDHTQDMPSRQRAWVLYEQALAASEMGPEYEPQARDYAMRALEHMTTPHNNQSGEASCLLILSEMCGDDVDECVDLLERATRAYWECHDSAWQMAADELVVVLLQAGRWDEARAWMRMLESEDLSWMVIFSVELRGKALCLSAVDHEWARWDALLGALEDENNVRPVELTRELECAAQLAEARGRHTRAARARALIARLREDDRWRE